MFVVRICHLWQEHFQYSIIDYQIKIRTYLLDDIHNTVTTWVFLHPPATSLPFLYTLLNDYQFKSNLISDDFFKLARVVLVY